MSLHKFQQDFQKAVLDELDFDQINEPPRGNKKSRLAVYQKAYFLRLIDVMSMDYEALQIVLGEEAFKEICHNYIKENPSAHYTLNDYGALFWQYLATKNELALSDLARFERILVEVGFSKTEKCLTRETLASVPIMDWPNLIFKLQSHVVIAHFTYDVITCFESQNHELIKQDTSALCWQKAYSSYYLKLNSNELMMVNAIIDGKNFMGVCESLHVDNEAEAGQTVASFIQKLVRQGILADCKCHAP